MQRKASAVWKGGLKDGKGAVSSSSGVLNNTPYSFSTRFENTPGTNPEELIAAAHAGCYSMALSAMLSGAGNVPKRVHTTSKVTFTPVEGGFAITKIELITEAEIPGIDNEKFQKIALDAKKGCPVSKALAAVPE